MSALPLPDCIADVLISNGAINLAADKHTVLGEVFRVLRPGGRLQIADMVRDPCTADADCGGGEESWANCVSGTLQPDTFLAMLSKAGFVDVELVAYTAYRTATSTTGALFKAIKPG